MSDAFDETTDPGTWTTGVVAFRVHTLERTAGKHDERLTKLERAMYFVAGLAAAGSALGGYLGRVLGG